MENVRDLLDSERFGDSSPYQVYATLLDEGLYHCSIRTMYRILHAHDQVRERRNQRRHLAYSKPELLATAPNQLWSWDITKLKGPATWQLFYLYVLLDVFSRYVVGWLIAERESSELARELISESYQKQGVDPEQLTLHADRGSPMISQTLAQLLGKLGVVKSHSRPHTANDNPFSEAQFKTMKYRPGYPERFGSLADARAWARHFFSWYNNEHRHSSLGLMTPATVHFGQAAALTRERQAILHAAYEAHPERFVKGPPQPPELPPAVWINPPTPERPSGSS
jgi:putative transposase